MPKFFEIFKPGKHIASDGSEVEFSAADLEAIAKSYNTEKHEAPMVVGHPKTNNPAYGWIKKVIFDPISQRLKVLGDQINPSFAEAVKTGSYKKVSASLYSPTSPNNPTPGQYYLRHVGFLGAQPPAIKGLEEVSFSEDEETLDLEMDFNESSSRELAYNDKTVGRVFRKLKNWLIEKFSKEEADQIIDEWELDALGLTAQEILAKENNKSFSENDFEAEKQKRLAAEEKLQEYEKAKKSKEDKEFCEALIKEGKLLPGQKDKALLLMSCLSEDSLNFGENETSSQIQVLKDILSSNPKTVEFGEVSKEKDGKIFDFSDPNILSAEAVKYQASEAEKGNNISISEAVRIVKGNS
ncbi:MAG: hypothetical protein ACK5N8_02230 [Alphaproteobacteria bacterium]